MDMVSRSDLYRAQNVSQCKNILSIFVKVTKLENVPLLGCSTLFLNPIWYGRGGGGGGIHPPASFLLITLKWLNGFE